jgi:hypothetical protein
MPYRTFTGIFLPACEARLALVVHQGALDELRAFDEKEKGSQK